MKLKFRHLVALTAATASLAGASTAQAEQIETIATGLDNPRSVAIGPDGAIYVANAGRGGSRCETGPAGDDRCFGLSGRIVAVKDGAVRTVSKGFASIGGVDGVFTSGVHGVSVAPDGRVLAVTGSGPRAEVRALPKVARAQAGRLFDASATKPRAIARVDAIEWERNVDRVRGDRNSNPYAVLALADRTIVVDAGANALYAVSGRSVKLLAVMPKNGRSQSVPSSVALGPDGALYVGELAEAAGSGKARVLRVPVDGGKPRVHARGFSLISGLAFAPDGSMYVTELGLDRSDFQGDVVRVAPDGSRTVLGAGKLLAPQGAAVDSAGAVYVSVASVLPRDTAPDGPFGGAGGTLAKITP